MKTLRSLQVSHFLMMLLIFFLYYLVMISILFLNLFLEQILKMHACHESSFRACTMSLNQKAQELLLAIIFFLIGLATSVLFCHKLPSSL